MKNTSKRSLRNDLRIVIFILKKTNEYSKIYLPVLVMSILIRAIQPLSYVIFPRFLIDELIGQKNIDKLILIVAGFVGTILILDIANKGLEAILKLKNELVMARLDLGLGKKAMEMDYEYLENPNIQDLKSKAIEGMRYFGGMLLIGNELINIISGILTLAALVYIVGKLNVVIVLFLFAIIALNTYFSSVLQNIVYKFWDRLIGINRRFRYLNALMMDFKYGKDIRLYNMKEIMAEKNENYYKNTNNFYVSQVKQEQVFLRFKAVIEQVQQIGVYGYLTYIAFLGNITIGAFTMYAVAANSLVSTFSALTKSFITIRRMCQYSEAYVEFSELLPAKVLGNRPIEKNIEHIVEFKNVSFKYPGSDQFVLKNISIRLTPSEKLSVVGLNGAGKTTFIKLLTRLYDPFEGEILLNGVNIKEYTYDEYLSLFAVVFQDFGLVAASIAENIAPQIEDTEVKAELFDAAAKAGLGNKIDSLKNGMNTQMYKIFDDEGVEFSGGEAQKLAIARAVYKDSQFVILDEPTAALDPIAEYEIYYHFDQLIGNKTTVYISHRLSSCRFCDSIAVFNDGEIVEQGSHDELILDTGGYYYKMFAAQAQYYV